jgi:carboxyl-terminal processing protease
MDRFKSGELTGTSEFVYPDSLKHFTAANRVVYSGGGILPDIFVALDTSFNSEFVARLSRRGILTQYALEYVDAKRKELEHTYPDIKLFKSNFEVTDQMLADLYEYAKKKEVEPKEGEDFSNSLPWLRNSVKALIARDIWKTSAYYEISNEIDPIFIEAVATLKDKKIFKKLEITHNH